MTGMSASLHSLHCVGRVLDGATAPHVSRWRPSRPAGRRGGLARRPSPAAATAIVDSLTAKCGGGYCEVVVSSLSPVIVLVLTFFLFVGHVCELPTEVAIVSHVHDSGGHSEDHHEDDGEASCDAVAGVRPTTGADSSLALAISARPAAAAARVPLHVVAAAFQESKDVSKRQPLFLLHSVFLI